MNRTGLWVAVGAALWVVLACDPKTTPKPTDPPKPVAQIQSSHHVDQELLR